MNDTQKEFEAWYLKEYGLDISENFVGEEYEYECHQFDFKLWQACQNLNNERIAKLEKTHKAEIALLNDAINDDKFLVRLCKQYEQALKDIWDGKAGSHFDAQMLAKEVLIK